MTLSRVQCPMFDSISGAGTEYNSISAAGKHGADPLDRYYGVSTSLRRTEPATLVDECLGVYGVPTTSTEYYTTSGARWVIKEQRCRFNGPSLTQLVLYRST